jgi:hypothetical protein
MTLTLMTLKSHSASAMNRAISRLMRQLRKERNGQRSKRRADAGISLFREGPPQCCTHIEHVL